MEIERKIKELGITLASQLLYYVFGILGQHARTAVGVNQLPMDITVEIDL
ncbi:hypothetical protein [Brevibacillus laterosporus]|nr:hypothetical protein [Brevibacillus laterosporus]ERM16097.1 hypothetical protein P615_05290 [Brevibacillus laterosporus PE36]